MPLHLPIPLLASALGLDLLRPPLHRKLPSPLLPLLPHLRLGTLSSLPFCQRLCSPWTDELPTLKTRIPSVSLPCGMCYQNLNMILAHLTGAGNLHLILRTFVLTHISR